MLSAPPVLSGDIAILSPWLERVRKEINDLYQAVLVLQNLHTAIHEE